MPFTSVSYKNATVDQWFHGLKVAAIEVFSTGRQILWVDCITGSFISSIKQLKMDTTSALIFIVSLKSTIITPRWWQMHARELTAWVLGFLGHVLYSRIYSSNFVLYV